MMIIWKYIKYPISLLLACVVLSCVQSDYTRLVQSELAKGIRNDSILLGIKFGDTRQDFFGRCFDLNKQRLVTQGPSGFKVQYLFNDSLINVKPNKIRLLFSPFFDTNEKIAEMDLEFSYLGWAPWNKQLQSDSLKINIMKLLMAWYKGNEFIEAQVEGESIPVKLDGNRRILVHIKDAQSVTVRVQDILHPKFVHTGYANKKQE
ncbi:MAG: hypothetical protein HYZ44_13845 [Bacteroidetes bacterium]|nr:hypothetical protein [Bacteroidota bacterium]